MNRRQHKTDYLQAMGIRMWIRREKTSLSTQSEAMAPTEVLPAKIATSGDGLACGQGTAIGQQSWDELRETVSQCQACAELVASRTQSVFGVGDQHADWLIIGEAPGADEDRLGEPFVGRAGQLLNAMLWSIGLQRQEVYIANILKCRPPNNRDPLPEEAQACDAFLQRQIALLQPKIILVVGRIAAQNLLKTETPIGQLRGSIHHYAGTDIPVVATYHPAYLLRSPGEKQKAWKDLCLARDVVRDEAGRAL